MVNVIPAVPAIVDDLNDQFRALVPRADVVQDRRSPRKTKEILKISDRSAHVVYRNDPLLCT
jgi:hypothetical protein